MDKIQDYHQATSAYQIMNSFKIAEIKQFLSENNLKKSAPKKIELCNRLFSYLESLPKKEILIIPKKIKLLDVLKKNTEHYSDVDYKYTLDYFKLNSNGSLNSLKNRLRKFAKMLAFYSKKRKKIVKIQKFFRNYIDNIIKNLRGRAFYDRNICHNEEDFMSFDELNTIPNTYFYSFQDKDGFTYGFDIRSLHEFIVKLDKKKPYNPYNNIKLVSHNIKNIYTLIRLLNIRNKKTKLKKIKFTNKYREMRDKAIQIFHKINMLNNYTDVNWFLDLDIYHLKKLYESAEDIWNYRAMHLTKEVRKKHIPNNDAFKIPPYEIFKIKDKLNIQNIILNEINKFITEGITEEERRTGAMWMLTALVEVSPAACDSMPHLFQEQHPPMPPLTY